MADDIPVAGLDPESTWDSDLDVSANSALRSLKPESLGLESAGVIYKGPDGKYARSVATTQKLRDGFALKTQTQKGDSLAGIWHVHPGDDAEGQVFSPNDIAMAKQLNVPSYVLFQKDGSIRKYVPGKTSIYDQPGADRMARNAKISKGDPVVINDDKIRKNAVERAYNDTMTAQSQPTTTQLP